MPKPMAKQITTRTMATATTSQSFRLKAEMCLQNRKRTVLVQTLALKVRKWENLINIFQIYFDPIFESSFTCRKWSPEKGAVGAGRYRVGRILHIISRHKKLYRNLPFKISVLFRFTRSKFSALHCSYTIRPTISIQLMRASHILQVWLLRPLRIK